MKALVLGGSGFVGSHVADALTAAGHAVTVFDLAPSPYLRDDQEFVAGDVADLAALEAATAGMEIVYNFGGIADIDVSRERPIDTLQVNVIGNANALEAARRAGVQRYVFASSIYVSSDAGSFYRVSKQACELTIEEYSREFRLPYTILRYGTLYGRRATPGNTIHRYLREALLERRIHAAGSGRELREYIHVTDAAKLSVDVLGEEFANEKVVLTGHHPLRVADLLTVIREIVGEDVEVVYREHEGPEERWSGHYTVTPYTFQPRLLRKLVSNYYVDMGQGLLDCLNEIHERDRSEG